MAKTAFIDGNPVTKTLGTRVMAAFLNLIFNHRHDGLNQDGSAPLDYALDTGTANNMVIALNPPLAAPVVGLPIWVRVAATNTADVWLTVDGLAAAPVIRNQIDDLAPGDIKTGEVIGVIWTGVAYQLTNYQSPPVTDAETLNGQTAVQLAPPGALMPFGMSTVPGGWLLCDGRAVLRATYPALYSAIGTTWGAGDNVSTFNLPDLRGEFLRGWDNGRGVDVGREMASFQADQFASHNHTAGDYTNLLKDPYAGSLTGTDYTGSGGEQPVGGGDAGAMVAAGGAETRPRNIAVLYCIKI